MCEEIQVNGIQVFSVLVHKNYGNAKKVYMNGGIRFILYAMKEHEASRPLNLCALNALVDLCAEPSCVKSFVRLGGYDIILSVMTIFDADKRVLVDACEVKMESYCLSALLRLLKICSVRECAKHLVNDVEDSIAVIMETLQVHKDKKDIVKLVCALIKTLFLGYPDLKQAVLDADIRETFHTILSDEVFFIMLME